MNRKQKRLTAFIVITFVGLVGYDLYSNGLPVDPGFGTLTPVQPGEDPFTQGKSVIHPFAIQKFAPGMKGNSRTAVAIDVEESLDTSMHYRGDYPVEVSDEGWRRSTKNGEYGQSSYSYQVLGQLKNGYYVVKTADWGGGSGVFMDVMVFELVESKTRNDYQTELVSMLVYKGKLTLGDRYKGDVLIVGNSVRIGKNYTMNASASNEGVFSFEPM